LISPPVTGCGPKVLSGSAAVRAPAASGRFGQLGHGHVHARLEHLGGALQAGVFAVMRQIGAIAPDTGGDRLAAFGMDADRARQAQQLGGPVQRQFANVLGDTGALFSSSTIDWM
jgi:hypothetical protein